MPVENREGSCIVVLATDAPLTARQAERLAKRCSLGLAVTGSYALRRQRRDHGRLHHRPPRAARRPRAADHHHCLQRPDDGALRSRCRRDRRERLQRPHRGRPPPSAATATRPMPCRSIASSRSCGATGTRRGCPEPSAASLPCLAAAVTMAVLGRSRCARRPARPGGSTTAPTTAVPPHPHDRARRIFAGPTEPPARRRLISRDPVRGRSRCQHTRCQGSGNHGCEKEARVRPRPGPGVRRPAVQWTNDGTSCGRS